MIHFETDASLTTVGGFAMNYVTGPYPFHIFIFLLKLICCCDIWYLIVTGYCWGGKNVEAPYGTIRNPLV